MHQELERFRIFDFESEALGYLLSNSAADFRVILLVSLAEIVNQQRKVEYPLVLQMDVGVAQGVFSVGKPRRLLDRTNAVLVDRVFMVLVELQQTPGVGKIGNDLFQHAKLQQPPQQLAQSLRIVQEFQELGCCLAPEQIRVLGAVR